MINYKYKKNTMKNPITKLFLTSVSVLLLALVGCSEQEEDATLSEMNEAVKNAGQMAFEESKDAWNEVQSATYDERAELQSFLENSASSVKDEASRMMSEAGERSSMAWNEAQTEYMEAQAAFSEEMSELSGATEANWSQLKDNVMEAWQDLDKSLNDMKESLNNAS